MANVGYTHIRGSNLHKNPVCPLCSSDVYGFKRGADFKCTNEECVLNKTTGWDLVTAINKVCEDL